MALGFGIGEPVPGQTGRAIPDPITGEVPPFQAGIPTTSTIPAFAGVAPTPPTIPTSVPKISGQNFITGELDPGLVNLLKTGGTPIGGLGSIDLTGAMNNPLTQAIGQAGQMEIDVGTRAFNNLFGNQYQRERERIASRGLVGSGPENEYLRQLAESQAGQLSQYVSGIQAETLKSQVDAAMNVLGLTNQREIANLDAALKEKGMTMQGVGDLLRMQSDRLMQEGQFNLAAQTADAANVIDLAGLGVEDYKAKYYAYSTEKDFDYRKWFDEKKFAMEEQGAIDEKDSENWNRLYEMTKLYVASGLKGQNLVNAINNTAHNMGLEDFDARYDMPGLGGNYNTQRPEGIQSGVQRGATNLLTSKVPSYLGEQAYGVPPGGGDTSSVGFAPGTVVAAGPGATKYYY